MNDEVKSNCCDSGCSPCACSASLKVVRLGGHLKEFCSVFIKRREIPPAIGSSLTHINMFPTELLLSIFSYCSAKEIDEILPRVCKLWEAVVRDGCLRKRLTLNPKDGLSTDDARREISSLPGLLDLRLIQYVDVVPLLQQAVLSNARLRKLTIKNCKHIEYMKCAQEILKVIKHTELCELTLNSSAGPMLMSRLFLSPQTCLKRITKLNLNFISYIKEEDFSHIVRCCPFLEDFRALTKNAVPFGDGEIIELGELRKTLRVLKVDAHYVSNNGLMLLTACRKLRKLCLRNLRCASGLVPLIHFRDLESLSLSHVNGVSNDDWVWIMRKRYWPNLQKLALVRCSFGDEPAICVSEQYPDLRILDVSGCKYVTPRGLKHLVHNCTFLEELSLCLTQSEGCLYWIMSTAPSIKKITYHCCCKDDEPRSRIVCSSEENEKSVCPSVMNLMILGHNQLQMVKYDPIIGCNIILENEDLSLYEED